MVCMGAKPADVLTTHTGTCKIYKTCGYQGTEPCTKGPVNTGAVQM